MSNRLVTVIRKVISFYYILNLTTLSNLILAFLKLHIIPMYTTISAKIQRNYYLSFYFSDKEPSKMMLTGIYLISDFNGNVYRFMFWILVLSQKYCEYFLPGSGLFFQFLNTVFGLAEFFYFSEIQYTGVLLSG